MIDDDKKVEKRVRLSIDLPDEYHKAIKISSTLMNITIRTWVLQAVIEKLAKEEKYR